MSKPTVYSYVRFSTPEQAMGDSERRQLESAQAWAKRKGHTLDGSIGQDRGKSGFHGTHRKKGHLGRFLERVKAGEVKPGSVLLVEKVTRLSREGAYKALKTTVFELLDHGIVLQTLSPELTFDQAAVDGPLLHVLVALLQSAFQESKDKSDYAASVWKNRRLLARADKKPMFNRLPAWLRLKNGKPDLVPERAAAVKRIFELAAAGYGQTRIVAALTAEGVPAFGERKVNDGRTRSQFSGVWTRAYVAKILRDRSAAGEFQPRGAGRKPEGPPIPGYFPAAVAEREWLLARAGQDGRKNKHAPRQSRHLNLFAGLVRGQEDGEPFVLHNDGSAASPRLSLVAAKSVAGRGPWVAFNYHVFEEAVLKCLLEIDGRELYPPAARESARLDVLRADLERTRREVAQLAADLEGGYSPAVSAVLRSQEAREAELKEALDRESAKAARPPGEDWREFKDLHEALAEAPDQADARLRLRALLRRRVREIAVYVVRDDGKTIDGGAGPGTAGPGQPRPQGRRLVILYARMSFHDAPGFRDYSIHYRPAANRKKGTWVAWSQSDGTASPGRMVAVSPCS